MHCVVFSPRSLILTVKYGGDKRERKRMNMGFFSFSIPDGQQVKRLGWGMPRRTRLQRHPLFRDNKPFLCQLMPRPSVKSIHEPHSSFVMYFLLLELVCTLCCPSPSSMSVAVQTSQAGNSNLNVGKAGCGAVGWG